MEDARRFLRYVTPGLVFIIELFLYTYITDKKHAIQLFKFLSRNGGWLTLLVGSGGIGFMISIIHHFLYWTCCYGKFLAVDHRDMLSNAEKKKYLKLFIRDSHKKLKTEFISRLGAWRIIANIWNTRKETSKRIKGANWTMDNLSDIMHSAGTIFVGTIIAYMIWLVWICKFQLKYLLELPSLFKLLSSSDLLLLFIIFVIILIHYINYRRTVINAQSFADMILYQELYFEYYEKGRKAEVVIGTSELKNCYKKY